MFPSDGASFPESAAEHEGETGAVGLYKPQSAELRSFSQNLVWKRIWWLFARKLTENIHSQIIVEDLNDIYWLLLTWEFYTIYEMNKT